MNMNAWNKLPETRRRSSNEVGTNPFRTTGGLTRSEYPSDLGEITSGGVQVGRSAQG